MENDSAKVVVLDRDGVINHDSDEFIKTVDEWQPIDGSLEAIGRLCAEGYRVFVFTNQSGIGRGFYTVETMQDMHEKMQKLLHEFGGHVEAVFFCPHRGEQRCDCRKPKPGMLIELASRFRIDLSKVSVVGDSWRDLEAGMQVNAQVNLVKTGKGSRTIREHKEDLEGMQVPVFKDLSAFVDDFLKRKVEDEPVS